MDEIKLSTKLVNALLQYLGSRPFVEVAGIIQAIQKEAEIQGAKPQEGSE
jgi:general stress protein 26